MQAKGKSKRQRHISTDEEKMVRALLAAFRHAGQPSFRSQRRVAAELGLTVPAVYSLLAKAFEKKLFHVLIDLPHEQQEVFRLEEAVRARFGLKKVLLVSGSSDILQELDPARRRELHTAVIRSMAVVVANYLDGIIGAVRPHGVVASPTGVALPFVLGVAWGRSMSLIARYLQTTPRPAASLHLKVVPIVGITAVLNAEPVEANIIAMSVAQAYGGVSEQLPCPAFVPTLEYGVVTQQDSIHQMIQGLRGCSVVLTSMGPIPDSSDDGSEITLSNDPALNAELLQAARRDGAIGEICYSLFNREGAEVRSDYRSIGLGFNGLRHIAGDKNRQVILVAGGDRRRFEPLKAALRARLASVLVSDTVTARFLVDEPLA